MNTLSPLFLIPGTARRLALALCLAGAAGPSHAQQPAPTGSIAELMELGIYSEETKGDIDAAMQVYQQILADTQATKSLAAQALFRLALCHDKKGDLAAATAACEKLIQDYPAEKDLVAAASEYLTDGAALLPAPWGDEEQVDYDIKLASGVTIGFGRYEVRRASLDGRPIWQFDSLQLAGQIARSRTQTEVDSMKPISCDWRTQLMGSAYTRYANGKAEITVAKAGTRSVDLPAGVVYDNEECLQLIRRLPLAVGYKRTLTVFVGLGGQSVPVALSVVGTEKIDVPAGSFECLKTELKLPNGVQTFWFANDARRYLIKFEAGMVAALTTAIRNQIPQGPVTMTEPTLGYSVTVPAGWIARKDVSPEHADQPSLMVVDQDGIAATIVKVIPKAKFGAEQIASLRALADNQIAAGKKFTTEFNVHEDSWKDAAVDGQPALSFVADHVKGPVKMLALVTVAMVGDNTVDISTYVAPEAAEAYRAKHEAILAGYRN